MTARKRPLSARLDKLGADLVAANQRVRDCEVAHRRAEADVARLSRCGGRRARGRRRGARLEGQPGARQGRERHSAGCGGAARGRAACVARADVERATFAAENLPGLLRERADNAHAVARRVQQALDGLAQAHAAWTAAEQDVAALVRLAGQETRDVARFPAELGELMRHARRVGDVEVPAPLPRALQLVTVAAFDDPDPAVREAARGQIAREAAA